MYRDITEIRQFYRSKLGRLTTKTLNRKIKPFWNALLPEDKIIVGAGFAIPYLDMCPHDRNYAVMSATQGVVRWPAAGPCRTVLSEDHILPFAENGIERLLLVHAVENADYLREFMGEVWRVLAPNGRVLIIVPNRRGLWSDSDKTPFGHGRPYSMKQLRALLAGMDFVIENNRHALYFFPSHKRLWRILAPALELLGELFLPGFGGVTIVEASKRLYNVTPLKAGAPFARLPVLPEWNAEPAPVASIVLDTGPI